MFIETTTGPALCYTSLQFILYIPPNNARRLGYYEYLIFQPKIKVPSGETTCPSDK